eukprot:TRINITY_DN5684_c0_g1_i1.p1 TRINITY_DN5684_c0_g1~~TRINITY_DN5684_c0_g1_i1.p1  ORF type:complete len:372 (+),score=65.54 TRINITY_DN5684_c0_g1_i1:818-1933(+)
MTDCQVTGQIVHMRKLSKKIMFVDILASSDGGHESRKTAVFKFWTLPPDTWSRCNRGTDKLHVGDIVQFYGLNEVDNADSMLSAQDYKILSLWRDISDGKPFVPIPPPSGDMPQPHEADHGDSNRASTIQPCKFFVNTGKCDTVGCPYRHDTCREVLKANRSCYVKERLEKRVLVHEAEFEGSADLSSASKRSEKFAEWIVSTYGEEYLSSGIILDVAGGRGDLAFELAVKRGFNCQIVDPRPQKLKRWQQKYLKKNVGVTAPVHHTTMFNKDFLLSVGLQPQQVHLIIGMHPDEATEVIVDTGLHHAIPVSLVPCCVFSANFPHRRLANGDVPRSLPQFIEYLKEKSVLIQHQSLPFVGRNTVLYTLPLP